MDIKLMIMIATASCSIISGLVTLIAAKVLIEYKIERHEKSLYGNGAPGVVEDVSSLKTRLSVIEAKCEEKHKHDR